MVDNLLRRFAVWYTGKSLTELILIDNVNLFFTRSRWRAYYLTVFGNRTKGGRHGSAS